MLFDEEDEEEEDDDTFAVPVVMPAPVPVSAPPLQRGGKGLAKALPGALAVSQPPASGTAAAAPDPRYAPLTVEHFAIVSAGDLADGQAQAEAGRLESRPSDDDDPADQRWHSARHWAEAAKGFAKARTMAQALCGMELLAIREALVGPVRKGRPEKKSQNLGLKWKDMLADRVGISDSSADIWMAMARAVQKRAIGESSDFERILIKQPWDWTPVESTAVAEVTRKLTDGKTQQALLQEEFAWEQEIGLAPSERGANFLAGPDRNNQGRPKLTAEEKAAAAALQPTPEQAEAAARDLAGNAAEQLALTLNAWADGPQPGYTPPIPLMALAATLEKALAAARAAQRNKPAPPQLKN